MKKAIIIIFGINFINLSAQPLYNAQWVIGDDTTSLLDETGINVLLDFRDDELEVSNIITLNGFEMLASNTSMCNSIGDLIFYTNGCDILNASHELMENGSGISEGLVEEFFCSNNIGSPIPQGIVSIPAPCSDSLYYVFNTDLQGYVYQSPNSGYAPLNLVYQLIDMSKNNGLGAVIAKNQVAVQDTLGRGMITASLHANGYDWWVVMPKSHSNCYYLVLITKNGVQEPIFECTGIFWDDDDSGSATFSPDGKKYARFNFQNGLNIMDFDDENGAFSNPISIQFPDDMFPANSGISFSPNSRFLYASARKKLYQFDLEANNVEESKVLVAEWDGFANPSSTIFDSSMLAPDGKIYIASSGTSFNLHVIHQPNLKGIDCLVEQHGVELPSWNLGSVPYLPHYTNYNSAINCDSITRTNDLVNELEINLYPNPTTSDYIFIHTANQFYEGLEIEIFDSSGKLLINKKIVGGQEVINLSAIKQGLFFYRIRYQGNIKQGKIIKIQTD